ncbi:L,D-transpeptidase [Rhizobium sp. 2MFCol3.1]|uniref:L,D-transpeptidase family protein n=1 Tax=Rhizobium sp. 2MFCol3.1 TaxID=1246459 RepID=UPI0003776195|nr:L,D-transpeptidase [Rhizobium sp. 2MFCol3.1]
MKKLVALSALAVLPFFHSATAQELTPDIINGADVSILQTGHPAQTSPQPDPAIIRLQVLLDRAGVSPGVIDGLDGANLKKAIAAFEAMQRLPVDGKLDQEVAKRVADGQQVIGPYKVEPDDVADLVEAIPEDYALQAEMKNLNYTSVQEKLSERFHMDIDLLRTLNPGSKFAPGDTIAVAIVGAPRTGAVKRIEARRDAGEVIAFAEDGSIIAAYPATIGSQDNPSPEGRHKINGVARNPKYEYNPKVNFQQGKNKKRLTLPSGPNNPVGSVWIDLSEPTYGIHGTPEPSKIDKSGSHGCVRLTNWDVEELASMVKPGVEVDFVK